MAKTLIRGNTQIIPDTITNAEINSAAGIGSTKLATWSADRAAGNFKLTGLGTPTAPGDAVTKSYADALAGGFDQKESVRAASTANLTLSGTQTVDGVALSSNDRILVKDQSTGSANGIYLVAAGAWTRTTDADASAEVSSGMTVYVSEGTINANQSWTLITLDPITLGTTALVFTQTSALGQITVDSTLTKSGSQLSRSVITGDVAIAAGSNVSAIGANKVTLGMQATLAANSVIGNNTGGTATPIAVAMSASATAFTIALRNGQANLVANNWWGNLATTATAAGTTTLTSSSARTQQFTGSTTQTVVLPDATTLLTGASFWIANRSSGTVTVNANGGGLIQTMAAGSQMLVSAVTVANAAGTWDAAYSTTSSGGGGGLSASNFVIRETVGGTPNGTLTSFTLANTPSPVGSEQIFLNGILQEPGAGNDYTISGTAITYLTAPATGDRVRATYMK